MLSPHSVDSSARSSTDQARVGMMLGRYRLTRVLGQGGMGVVYEAFDTSLDRKVAVKLITESFSGDGDAAERLLREAQASARLNHPNVVTIHHIGQQDSQSFIVMELMEGGCVQQQVEARNGLSWQEATRVTSQVCRGLAAAHAAKLIHRDIKPSNILLSANKVAKLADFGLVRMLDESQLRLTATGMLVGSPYYMSPEQCGSDRVDELSDIYSLGATYFALLIGHPPYRGTHPVKICFEHCSAAVPDPRTFKTSIPDACAEVVMRAMAKRPEDRFVGANEMLSALKLALQTGETMRVASPGAEASLAVTPRVDQAERTEMEARPAPPTQPRRAAPEKQTKRGWRPTTAPRTKERTRRAKPSRKARRMAALLRRRLKRAALALVVGVACVWLGVWFFGDRSKVDSTAGDSTQPASGGGTNGGSKNGGSKNGGGKAVPSDDADVASFSVFRRSINELGGRSFVTQADVTSIVVSPKGDWFASTERNGRGGFSVWSLATGEQMMDFGLERFGQRSGNIEAGFESSAVVPDGNLILTGQSRGSGTGVFVWTVGTEPHQGAQKFERTLHPVSGDCRSVSVSRNGWLVVAAGDFENRLAEIGDRPQLSRVRLWDVRDGSWQNDLKLFSRRVFACAFSPTDEYRLATLDSFGMLSVWDTRDVSRPDLQCDLLTKAKSESSDLEANAPAQAGLAFSPDGQRVAVVFDGELQVWSATQEQRLLAMRTPQGTLSRVAFSPDGKLLATVSVPSNRVSLRRADTLDTLHEFSGHTAQVTSVAFVPGDTVLISGGDDRRVILWDYRRWRIKGADGSDGSGGANKAAGAANR